LHEKHNGRISFLNTSNPSVKVTLELLEEINKVNFDIKIRFKYQALSTIV